MPYSVQFGRNYYRYPPNPHSDIVKGTNKVQEWSNNTSINSKNEHSQILKILYNRLENFVLRQVFFDCLLPDTKPRENRV